MSQRSRKPGGGCTNLGARAVAARQAARVTGRAAGSVEVAAEQVGGGGGEEGSAIAERAWLCAQLPARCGVAGLD